MITERRLLLPAFVAGVVVMVAAFAAVATAAPPQPAASQQSSYLIKPDGSLFAWGLNDYGQLGVGDHAQRFAPTRVGSDVDWASVVPGGWHVLALKSGGSLYAWGDNRDGRLGLGNTTEQVSPQLVDSGLWTQVAAGSYTSYGIKDGKLYAWGDNTYGQLGQNTSGAGTNLTTPTQVGSDSDWMQVSAGRYFAAALKTNGELYTWGRNDHGQLGFGDKTDRLVPAKLGSSTWSEVRCGDIYVLALNTDGTLYSWGYNNYGQLGLGDTAERTSPVQIDTSTGWVIDPSDDNSLALKGGTLYGWGDNTYGQLAEEPVLPGYENTPTVITGFTDWTAMAMGDDHSLGIRPDGSGSALYAWGHNSTAQLGLGDTTDRHAPTFVFYADDLTAPTVTSLTSATNPDQGAWSTNPTPTFTWTGSDPGTPSSGIYGYTHLLNQSSASVPLSSGSTPETSFTAPTPLADGTWYFHVRAVDKSGNVGAQYVGSLFYNGYRVRIDATPPVTSDNAPAGWSKTPVALRLTATDATSGVASTTHSVDGGSPVPGTSFSVSGDGVHVLHYSSTDVAGNVEAEKTANVRIDATAPVTTADAPSGTVGGPVTVHFRATDAVSGVAATKYSIDNGPWKDGPATTALVAAGTYTIKYHSIDNAGNVEADKTAKVTIAGTPVAIGDDAPSGWHNHSLTVHFTTSDPTGKIEYSVNGGAYVAGPSVTITAQGSTSITYHSVDALGHAGPGKTCTVNVDTKRPAPKALKKVSVRRGKTASLPYKVGDAVPGSPTAKVIIKIKTLGGKTVKVAKLGSKAVNTSFTYRFKCKLAKKTYKYYVYATDAAGNKQLKPGVNKLVVR